MSREITIAIADSDKAREAIALDPYQFACRMREALTANSREAFDDSRQSLRAEFNIVIAATRETFDPEM